MNARIARTRIASVPAWLLVGMLAHGCASQTHAPSRAESDARGLEARLHAPCCRGQMLEAHESPTVTALRLELRQRITSGQSVAEVERALIAQYGPSIIAVPVARDPRGGLSLALAVLLAVSAAALVLAARRWMRRSSVMASEPSEDAPNLAARDALDQRIDAELARLDGKP